MSSLKDKAIACAGNWIVDIVQTIDTWPQKSDLVHIRHEVMGVGGGAANVVLDLAAFDAGLRLYAVGLVGGDAHAGLCRSACDAAGVDRRWLKTSATAMTAHTQVMNVPGDSRTFFYHPGCNDALTEADIPVEEMAAEGVGIFYLGYINLLGALDALEGGTTGAARILSRARACGMVTVVDLVSADTSTFAATVMAALPTVDYLFLNEVEAARTLGRPPIPAGDRAGLEAAARALQAAGAGRVVLHTGQGALWFDGAPLWAEPCAVAPGDIVSPVGAGDAFCAGALYGIHQGWDAGRCLSLAHRAAAASLKGATATEGIPPLRVLLG
ncbi:carbohydrate kinase family protein [Stagnihabitans tardus]|uniref:carbohydrate kinase family protein n=1 Tax=Stagnihabitans tardus TaxID=2699202 RepID=UPI00338F153A